MSYTLNLTNGSVFAALADGTINTDSSLTIIGKNYAGYGEFIGENFLRVLENGANTTEPVNPLSGQLWFDTSEGILKVYSGSEFKNLGAANSSVIAPAAAVQGDLWFDPNTSQLKVYDGSTWILVGPNFTSATGVSGAFPEVILDAGSAPHIVIKDSIDGVVVGILSKDATFTPQVAIAGFGDISPGYNVGAGAGGTAKLTAATADIANIDITKDVNDHTIISTLDNTKNISIQYNATDILSVVSQGGTAEVRYYGPAVAPESIVTKNQMETYVTGNSSVTTLVDSNDFPRASATLTGLTIDGNVVVNNCATFNTNAAILSCGVLNSAGAVTSDTLAIASTSTFGGNVQVDGNLTLVNTGNIATPGNVSCVNVSASGDLIVNGVLRATDFTNAFVAYEAAGQAFCGGHAITGGVGTHVNTTLFGSPVNIATNTGTIGVFNDTGLDITGDITASGDITAFSDISLKDDVEVIPEASAKIAAMRGVTYTRNDYTDATRHMGVIAQEIESVIPEVVIENDNGLKSVAYGNIVGLLIEGIKDLQREVSLLQRDIVELKKMV